MGFFDWLLNSHRFVPEPIEKWMDNNPGMLYRLRAGDEVLIDGQKYRVRGAVKEPPIAPPVP